MLNNQLILVINQLLNDELLNNKLILVINSLMGIPPVVVGLIVYFIFSNQGPLGILSFLFTPHIMIIAQMLIVYPIISSFAPSYTHHSQKML